MSTPLSGRGATLRGKNTNGSGGGASTAGGVGGYGSGYPISNPNGRGVANFAARQAQVESRLARLEEGARTGQISFTSMLDGSLEARDLLGNLKMTLGKQTDGKWGVTYSSGVAPPRPSLPLVSARQLGFVVGWDGTFADGFDRPSDLSRVDVHVSTEGPDFVPSQGTAYGSIFSEGAQPVFGNIQTYWVKLVAVSTADVPSPPSAAVDVTPLPAKALAAEIIAGIHFAGEIFMGTTFFAGDPKGSHAEFNKSGLALYRSDQTPTVVFSTEEGNALITGSIQTAPPKSGKPRIVFNPFPEADYNAIRFYAPGDDAWSAMAASYGQDGTRGALSVSGPLNSVADRGAQALFSVNAAIIGLVEFGKGGYFGNSLTIDANQQQFRGNGISLLTNYDTGNYQDLYFAWQDSLLSGIHQDSALELVERKVASGGSGQTATRHFPSWSCPGQNIALVFKDNGIEIFDYNTANLAHVRSVETSSSELNKTDIEDLAEVMSADDTSALSLVMQVAPRRFRRVDRSVARLPSPVPDVPPAQLSTMTVEERAELSPPMMDVPTPNYEPEFGLIAEELVQIVPETVDVTSSGDLHLKFASLIALVWSATQDLSTQVDEVRKRVDSLSS